MLDPVLRASDGTPLLEPGGLERMAGELLPRVTVLTPNRAEAGALLGRAVTSEREAEEAARELAARGPAVLVTGGDAGGDEVVDVLVDRDGRRHRVPSSEATVTLDARHRLHAVRRAGGALASGVELAAAVGSAIDYVRRAMDPGLDLGRGRAPLDHGAGDGT